jgi:2-methylcitrate dehydratase PrpD
VTNLTFENIPPDVLETARRALADTLAVALRPAAVFVDVRDQHFGTLTRETIHEGGDTP